MDPAVTGPGRQIQIGDDLVEGKLRVQGEIGRTLQQLIWAGSTETPAPFEGLGGQV